MTEISHTDPRDGASPPADVGALLRRLQSPWTVVLAAPLVVLVLDPGSLGDVVRIAVEAFAGTLPYIAVAVLLIAGLKAAGAEAVIATAFQGRERRMIVLAALFGGLAPFCSCEVIPFIAGLLALGAPLSAVMAFWLSSPLIDPPTLFITAGALGWPFAIGKAAAAVLLGLFGGFAVRWIARLGFLSDPLRRPTVTGCGCEPAPLGAGVTWRFWRQEDRRATFGRELVANGAFLVKWLALAYVLEALLITYVPAAWIAGLVGGSGPLPVIVAALIGVPAYLNSYVAPPLLAGLISQGMSVGAAMSFMVAGAVTCIPAMAAVYSLVRRRVFALYLGLGLLGAVLSGLAFQGIVS